MCLYGEQTPFKQTKNFALPIRNCIITGSIVSAVVSVYQTHTRQPPHNASFRCDAKSQSICASAATRAAGVRGSKCVIRVIASAAADAAAAAADKIRRARGAIL